MSATAKPRARLKARRMWADYDPSYPRDVEVSIYGSKADQRSNRPDLKAIPVAVIPLDDVDALAARLAYGWMRQSLGKSGPHFKKYEVGEVHLACARAALSALGLLPARRGKKAK